MSIASVEVPQSHLLALWLIWSGVALALAPIALRGSGRTLFTRRLETSPVIGPLVISAVVTFVGWIGVAMAYGAVMQIIAGEGRTPEITGGHLVAISLAAPLGGLAAALAMLGAFELFETVGITRRRFPAAVLSGLIGITIALPVVWWVLEATLRAWEAMRFEHPAKHGLLEAMAHESRWWMNGAIVLSAVVIAPLFEEVLFRGLVQTCVRRATGYSWIAVLVSSALFALVHDIWMAPPIFVLAVMIGITYELTGSLWSAIVMHAVFNGFSIATSGSG